MNIKVRGAKTHSQRYLANETIRLAREWGIDGDGIIKITNRSNSCAWAGFPWEITYGRSDIEDTRKWGMYEYATVKDMLYNRNLPVQLETFPLLEGNSKLEQCSLDILAAHEVAHVLQYRIHKNKRYWTGKRWENSIKPHGPEWREIYAHLLDCIVEKWDPTSLVLQYFGRDYPMVYHRE